MGQRVCTAIFLSVLLLGAVSCGSDESQQVGIWAVNRCADDIVVQVAAAAQSEVEGKAVPSGDDIFVRNIDPDSTRIFFTVDSPAGGDAYTTEYLLANLQAMPASGTRDRQDFQVSVVGPQCP